MDHFDPYNVLLAIATNTPVTSDWFCSPGSHIKSKGLGSVRIYEYEIMFTMAAFYDKTYSSNMKYFCNLK